MPIIQFFLSIFLNWLRQGGLVMFSLPALCLWGEFCNLLLVNAAHLPGPLGALGVGCVTWGLILTLLLHLSPTLSHIILGKKISFREFYKCELSCIIVGIWIYQLKVEPKIFFSLYFKLNFGSIQLTSTSWGCCTVSHSDSYSVEQT